jgi:hypothetical protein
MPTKVLSSRWLLLALAVVLVSVVAFVGYASLDRATSIRYYRVVGDRTLLVGTQAGLGANVRVTGLVETPDAVTITVSTFLFQLPPSTSGGYRYESEARLMDVLGERTVIDGSTGLPVPFAYCPLPAFQAAACP